MKRIYFLLFPMLVLLACGCGNKGGSNPANSQQKLIVGKWNLQKQNSTTYVDGTQQSAVTEETSNKYVNYVEFDTNGNYTSLNYYNSGGIGSTDVSSLISTITVTGTYNFSGATLNLSVPALAGFDDGKLAGTSGVPEVIHLVSQSAQIIQLSSSVFTLHVEYTTTHTTDTYTKNYKSVLDYYYTR